MIDISKLSAAELDQLIADAARRRATLEPGIPSDPPAQRAIVGHPNWTIEQDPRKRGDLIFGFRHPGLGWVYIALPPQHRNHILSWLLQYALNQIGGAEQPMPMSSGSTVH